MYGEIFLNQVLYVPDMLVNLLSARFLVLDDFEINFQKIFVEITKFGQIKMQGKNISNLPSLNFQQNQQRERYLSSAEFLHKALGHTIAFLVGTEAKRFGYFPMVLHSDRGTESILDDSGINRKYWNEIAKVSTLTLNQIPSHKSIKSPFELFKQRVIPLTYFYPMGNRVAIIDQPKESFSKLAPNGKLGILIGYNDELLSYRVLSNDGKIISTKHLKFLDYSNLKDYNLGSTLTIGNDEDDLTNPEESIIDPEELTEEIENFESAESSSEVENDEVAASLVPIAIPQPQSEGRVLRERTDKAMECGEGTAWRKAVDQEIDSIEHHEVWDDMHNVPKLFLKRFPNSSAHDPDTLLGMELRQEDNSISLSQEKLIDKGLAMMGMSDCRSVLTPLSVNLKINYRSFTGILNFLACRKRPDLAPEVSILSSFNNEPGIKHWKEVQHCWKYLKGTLTLKLTLRPNYQDNSKSIQHYTDATWADDSESRLSRSGSICFWKNCPISWNSKKQKSIAMSSTEAELNALSDGVQENQWIKFIAEELWNKTLLPSTFHIDNPGLDEKIKNFGTNSKTKNLDIKLKWLQDLKERNKSAVKLIPSEEMIADSLKKAN
ncbi:hypothetical protein VP01_1642g5 [Puccinia sorghi]|uniref:Reverse transcriptase Ty1/copia-type domain-containing protein n=1 Tax=Puccinia sorghi TaxID=27349 RepID=A0A0L6VII9_9BASI|nr:hypothetical protein VP01_1642g5 [Puccinia sorghi]